MEEKYKGIFSIEERRALSIFYAAGADIIKRTEEEDLIVGVVSSNPKEGLLRRIDGDIIPEEWFPEIKPEEEYYLKDIFGDDRTWLA